MYVLYDELLLTTHTELNVVDVVPGTIGSASSPTFHYYFTYVYIQHSFYYYYYYYYY